ncbi:hypothetical protein AKJ16_DCAP22582 [Drosera capensis]
MDPVSKKLSWVTSLKKFVLGHVAILCNIGVFEGNTARRRHRFSGCAAAIFRRIHPSPGKPNPTNGVAESYNLRMDQNSNGDSKCETLTEPVAVEPIQRVHLSDDAAKAASDAEVPDWLPAGWRVDTRVRAAGASAGTKDKFRIYSIDMRWPCAAGLKASLSLQIAGMRDQDLVKIYR